MKNHFNQTLKSSIVILAIIVAVFHFHANAEILDSNSPKLKKYHKQALPFLEKYCYSCHGDKKQKGDLNIKTLGLNMKNADIGQYWEDIYAQVQFDEMPTSKAKFQPTRPERDKFLKWLDEELIANDRGFGLDEKLILPEYGNYIDHESLFSGTIKDMPYTPARIWRQRPSIYKNFWDKTFGRTEHYAIAIGGTGPNFVKRGPHKGKNLTGRYFKVHLYANPFFEFVHHAAGFSDYASIVADQSSLEALLVNAETMAETMTRGQKVTIHTRIKSKDSVTGNNGAMFVGGVISNDIERRGRIPLLYKTMCEEDYKPTRKDFNQALDIAFAIFLRRAPLEDDYEKYYQKVYKKNLSLGNEMALQAVLIYICLSPEFVYRMELGLGKEDQHGRRMLSPQEIVFALQYAMDDNRAFGVKDIPTIDVYTKNTEAMIKKQMLSSRPVWAASDNWLVQQMRKGKLSTRQDVEIAVRHLLNQRPLNVFPKYYNGIISVRNPRIIKFFREYFGYHKAKTVFKDVDNFKKRDGFKHFHNHTAIRTMIDTDALILDILNEDKNVLYELLTTNKVYVSFFLGENQPSQIKRAGGKEKYIATHDTQNYNLDPFEHAYKHDPKQKRKPFFAPKDQRCGILTQPSWLVAHSGNFENDPVRRGKWIREHLLAGVVMEVPIGVDAKVPEDEHKTLRERFSVVEKEECWRCHKKMNPLGMPFEAYNHVGRWRPTEKDKPVNTKGLIKYTNDRKLHTRVENVRDMMERIAKSDLARQSFLRHVFRYWMGRNEMLSDSKTLIAMDQAYLKSGGSFKEVLVSLLTSDSFLYRK